MSAPGFAKLLVANRGEIAVRVIRACRELGLPSVAVYSEADADALHVRLADEARPIGKAAARESYLDIERVLRAARESGADAIHPGYGFLSENAEFARACEQGGIVFVGPRSETIALMGEKTSARREAVAAGVPVVPGALAPHATLDEVAREAERLGYPVMLKAAAGGGGKGLRLVASRAELEPALARARSEAHGAFGDDSVYLEKALVRPRHVEIQVLADHGGRAVHLFERECSIQRRHQKLVEESPSPLLDEALRAKMGELALALTRRVGYVNAGTLEFLVDAERRPYFLEMNTRLQVEHPVTELVTGIDLVKQQLRIAAGEPLALEQHELRQRGHAIECRVYAEDPDAGFLPSPGRIEALRAPGGPGVRDDSGVCQGATIPIDYDPLISKLAVWAETRPEAIARLRRAVREYRVVGVRTTLPFFDRLLRAPEFAAGDYDTAFADTLLARREAHAEGHEQAALVAAAIAAFEDRRRTRPASVPAAASAWLLAARREATGASAGTGSRE